MRYPSTNSAVTRRFSRHNPISACQHTQGYMEKPERWQADNTQKKGKPEPDNYRCKEFCVAVGDYRGIPNGG